MYASRATCSRCASQLRSAQARAACGTVLFSSLSEATTPPRSPSVQGREDRRDTRHAPNSIKLNHHDRHFKKHQPYKRSNPNLSEKSALALFNKVVKSGPNHRHLARTPQSSSSPTELEIAAKLKEITNPGIGRSPQQKVRNFVLYIQPHLKDQPFGIPDNILAAINRFLTQTCDEMVREGLAGEAIALSVIGSSFGNFDLPWRNQLVLNICYTLLHQGNSQQGCNLSQELVNMWKHLSHLGRLSTRKVAPPRFVFPTIDEVLKDIKVSGNADRPSHGNDMLSSVKALTSIFLQFPPEEARNLLPGLLATMAILSDPQHSQPSNQVEAAPLLELVAAVLKDSRIAEPSLSDIFRDRVVFPESKLLELQSYVTDRWPDVTTMLFENDASWRQDLNSATSSDSTSAGTIEGLHNQLRQAHESRNPVDISFLWNKVNTRLITSPSFAEQLRESTEFLDEWVFVWCATRQGEKVQDTLDLMRRVKVRPTIRTYTNMMHGWKICKEGDKIEALWEKLEKSGVRLDAFIWTERISSLIEIGKPQAGIQALAKMQALWKAAAANDAPHTAVQPTINVVNAVFKGLIKLDRRAAFEVLEWAGREQIEPDVRTYNILLQQSFRNNPPDDIQRLLKAMNDQGIDPDEATFTIILEGVLKSVRNASAAEQVEAVQYVFDEMKLSGLKANVQTYGKMLYAVAEFAAGADETIDAVLTHMREDGLSVTPHMVTIMIERSLRNGARGQQQSLAVIQELLSAHGFTDVSEGDQTLWERVMSAHAVLGDTSGALALFDRLAELGRPVTSLACLSELLRALLANKELDAAQTVVQMVLDYKVRNTEGPSDARYWHHRFWSIAKDNGLFNAEDIPAQIRTWMGEWRMSRNR